MFHNNAIVVLFLLLISLPVAASTHTCRADIPATTPNSQLIDNGNSTVTDIKTGLMWKQCSEGLSGIDCAGEGIGYYKWEEAFARVRAVNTIEGGFAGYSDWRLPNIKELRSIVENQCVDPPINAIRFPNSGAVYWSSSPSFSDSYRAWYVRFYSVGSSGQTNKDGWVHIRLVRGGE